MSGTLVGGKAAALTNKDKYGIDFYRRIGAIGGSHSRTGGFYVNRELASVAGAIGGRISRRGKDKLTEKERRQIKAAYKELLAIHKAANKNPRIDEGAIAVYSRRHGLVTSK